MTMTTTIGDLGTDPRGLSLLQPHAQFMAHGLKRIETRSWMVHWRGTIVLHASARKLTRDEADDCREWEAFRRGLLDYHPEGLPYGVILAVAELVTVLRIPKGKPRKSEDLFDLGEGIMCNGWKLPPDGDERAFGDYTPGRFAWCTANLRVLEDPIPHKGQRGLWTIPTALRRRIESAPRRLLAQDRASP